MLSPRDKRRQRQRGQPFPNEWARALQTTRLYRRLPAADRSELHGHIHVLLAEKRFEGAAGLVVNDTMRILVAGQASVLLLHRPSLYFAPLRSVVLYPTEYSVREEIVDDNGLVDEIDELRAGESWTSGAVVLSWADVAQDLTNPRSNVVLHEFAHQLDAEDGAMNGAPILADPALRRRWANDMSAAYEDLTVDFERGTRSFLDAYGSQDPAEFFAVATEVFFLDPLRLQRQRPSLYDTLGAYYRQDPSRW